MAIAVRVLVVEGLGSDFDPWVFDSSLAHPLVDLYLDFADPCLDHFDLDCPDSGCSRRFD